MQECIYSDQIYNRIHNVVMDINCGEITAKNGHYLIETLLDIPPNQSKLPDFYKTVDPKVEVMIVPPTEEFNNFCVLVFTNRSFANMLSFMLEHNDYDCEHVRYGRNYQTVIHDNMNGEHVVDLSVFKAIGANTFSYKVINTPHSTEMMSYYLEGLELFCDKIKNRFRVHLYERFVAMLIEAEDDLIQYEVESMVKARYPDFPMRNIAVQHRRHD